MTDIADENILEEELYKAAYNRYKESAEEKLAGYLPEVDERSGVLRDAMLYSLEAGGKRLRPVLLLAACESVGGDIKKALPFACAIEFIHTYSLIHDDHPSMDNDDLRRGKPTNHKIFGDDIAILAGDGLLNSAMDVMLEAVIASKASEKDSLVNASYEISRAAGTRGMIAGQTSDVLMTGRRAAKASYIPAAARPEERASMLRYIHRNKTGALIRAAVRAGAILGGADSDALEALTFYAEKLGIVFQIVDDILDVTGDDAMLGKNTGMDEALGKLTYPALFGLEASYAFAADETEAAVKALQSPDARYDFMIKLALDLQKRIS